MIHSELLPDIRATFFYNGVNFLEKRMSEKIGLSRFLFYMNVKIHCTNKTKQDKVYIGPRIHFLMKTLNKRLS